MRSGSPSASSESVSDASLALSVVGHVVASTPPNRPGTHGVRSTSRRVRLSDHTREDDHSIGKP